VSHRPVELVEYTSTLFNDLCARLGVVQSMGRVGSALDNAVSESFNSALKVEFVHRQAFDTRAEARIRIATWISDFYNTRRRHSAAGDLAPAEFERIMKERRSTNDHHAAQAA
jgi:putative transposase